MSLDSNELKKTLASQWEHKCKDNSLYDNVDLNDPLTSRDIKLRAISVKIAPQTVFSHADVEAYADQCFDLGYSGEMILKQLDCHPILLSYPPSFIGLDDEAITKLERSPLLNTLLDISKDW